MSVAGFDFQQLNRVALSTSQPPVNQAANYGVSVVKAPPGPAWRCIGVFKLAPQENRGRHNCFIEVLDENGNRTRQPVVNWTWYMDAPTQTVKLDKPANEPAADIPVEKSYTVTLRINGGGLPSDSVGGIHTRHADEGEGSTYGHHSYYVVFQRRQGSIIAPPVDPDPIDPPAGDLTALQAENAKLRKENAGLRAVIADAIGVLEAA